MSVRKGERTEGKLRVLLCAENLSRYTLTVCKNEKVMPKSQRWLLTQRIVGSALDAVACITKANAAPLNEPIGAVMRYIWQVQAKGHIRTLLSLLDLAQATFGLDLHRVEHWVELAVDTDKSLAAWVKSDRQRTAMPGLQEIITVLHPLIMAASGLVNT